jgi:hypothetical protein
VGPDRGSAYRENGSRRISEYGRALAPPRLGGELENLHRVEIREHILPIALRQHRPRQTFRGDLAPHGRRVIPQRAGQGRRSVRRVGTRAQIGSGGIGLMSDALCVHGMTLQATLLVQYGRAVLCIACPSAGSRAEQEKFLHASPIAFGGPVGG